MIACTSNDILFTTHGCRCFRALQFYRKVRCRNVMGTYTLYLSIFIFISSNSKLHDQKFIVL